MPKESKSKEKEKKYNDSINKRCCIKSRNCSRRNLRFFIKRVAGGGGGKKEHKRIFL